MADVKPLLVLKETQAGQVEIDRIQGPLEWQAMVRNMINDAKGKGYIERCD